MLTVIVSVRSSGISETFGLWLMAYGAWLAGPFSIGLSLEP
jgi:hypothetical protein